jgi:hypothetical protein
MRRFENERRGFCLYSQARHNRKGKPMNLDENKHEPYLLAVLQSAFINAAHVESTKSKTVYHVTFSCGAERDVTLQVKPGDRGGCDGIARECFGMMPEDWHDDAYVYDVDELLAHLYRDGATDTNLTEKILGEFGAVSNDQYVIYHNENDADSSPFYYVSNVLDSAFTYTGEPQDECPSFFDTLTDCPRKTLPRKCDWRSIALKLGITPKEKEEDEDDD